MPCREQRQHAGIGVAMVVGVAEDQAEYPSRRGCRHIDIQPRSRWRWLIVLWRLDNDCLRDLRVGGDTGFRRRFRSAKHVGYESLLGRRRLARLWCGERSLRCFV